jgi:uncharacterized membrane protein
METPDESAPERRWQRLAMLRPRMLASLAAGAAIALATTDGQNLSLRLVVGWDAAILILLLLLAGMMGRATPQAMRRRAEILQAGRWVMLGVTSLAAAASLVAIATLLGNVHDLPRDQLAWHVTLGAFTIVPSWIFLHTMYALDYAHGYYYRPDHHDSSRPPGGLGFPGETHPDYWDFLYFSFVIGMTCQVSDVTVQSKPMRRLVLAHGVLAFFFNTGVLALAINITASLI